MRPGNAHGGGPSQQSSPCGPATADARARFDGACGSRLGMAVTGSGRRPVRRRRPSAAQYDALALGLPRAVAAMLLVDAMHHAGPASPATDFHSDLQPLPQRPPTPRLGPTRQQQRTQTGASKVGTYRRERSEDRTARSLNNTRREGSLKRPSAIIGTRQSNPVHWEIRSSTSGRPPGQDGDQHDRVPAEVRTAQELPRPPRGTA